MSFKDHFSGHADAYARFRPSYPAELYDFLASLPARRSLAWDCATGNGQAALDLAERFGQVIATDASAEQIAHARPHPKVAYRVAPAESCGIEAGTVDLVTVSQAVHWFHFEAFYREVRRVAAPGAALAVWTYALPTVSDGVDPLIERYYGQIVGAHWPPERCWVEEDYRTIPFPFEEERVPELATTASWNCEDFGGYLGTWSATARYRAEHGEDPRERIAGELREAWGEGRRTVRWPMQLRVGRP